MPRNYKIVTYKELTMMQKYQEHKLIKACQPVINFDVLTKKTCSFKFRYLGQMSRFILQTKKSPEKTSFISFPILEKDELERIGYMVQRDNLLRNLGVPELVYRLLNGIKPTRKPQMKSSSGKQINVYNVRFFFFNIFI